MIMKEAVILRAREMQGAAEVPEAVLPGEAAILPAQQGGQEPLPTAGEREEGAAAVHLLPGIDHPREVRPTAADTEEADITGEGINGAEIHLTAGGSAWLPLLWW